MYPVAMLCRVLRVSRSGFYAWQQRPISPRAEETRRLDIEIKKLFAASKRRSGSPKITRALVDGGWSVGKNRVARRMLLGLRSIVRRRFKVTTNSQHRFAVAPNRLQRDFTAQRPNQVWVSDLTYLSVGCGWLYLVVVIDLYSRRVVGWALSSALDHRVALVALQRAVAQRRPPRGLIIHSDRGVQYACTTFTNWVSKHGFVQSMSRKSDCWDNAVAESFFHLLQDRVDLPRILAPLPGCLSQPIRIHRDLLQSRKESFHPGLRNARSIRAAFNQTCRLKVSIFPGNITSGGHHIRQNDVSCARAPGNLGWISDFAH